MSNIVCFSGGKDSTAMLLKMIEDGEKIDRILFADTKFEFPELYEYIKEIQDYIGREIEFVYPESDFIDRMKGKISRGKRVGEIRGYPLRYFPCYWTREAKVKPMQKIEKQYKQHNVCIGIAVDEANRIQKKENLRYPLIEWKWTEDDCVNYLKKRKLLNPLYKKYNRIGCYHCPKQSVLSLYSTYLYYPDLRNKIKERDRKQVELKGEHILFSGEEKTVYELEKDFENGIIPKEEPKYDCFSCESVKKFYQGYLIH